jgi:hypothetical protein
MLKFDIIINEHNVNINIMLILSQILRIWQADIVVEGIDLPLKPAVGLVAAMHSSR